jgi:Family of unknown function (DUF5329)
MMNRYLRLYCRRTGRIKALRGLVFVVISVFLLSVARATPPPAAVLEVDYLLQQVETSGCAFYRNGSWYDGAHAKAHLQMKYNYLVARDLIGSVDDFIDKAAQQKYPERPTV